MECWREEAPGPEKDNLENNKSSATNGIIRASTDPCIKTNQLMSRGQAAFSLEWIIHHIFFSGTLKDLLLLVIFIQFFFHVPKHESIQKF